ncbi:MAG: AAA family ATPase [Pirellulales bacterium]|nr:AAA family ATPase [Pirellulales bacterium]
MYLSRFGVKNYKCLGEIDIPLTPIHVLIGQNDCGKTSLLEAMYAFCASSERPIDEAFPKPWSGRELVLQTHPEPRIELWGAWGEVAPNDFFAAPPRLPYGLMLDVVFKKTGAKYSTKCMELDKENRPSNPVAQIPDESSIKSWRKQVHKYSLDAKLMAVPAVIDPIRRFRLDPDGFGLATLLDDILGFDPNIFLNIRKEFCRYFPQFRSFRVETETAAQRHYESHEMHSLSTANGKGIYFETQSGGPVRARHTSDGAILFLGFLALAHLPDPPSLLLIEEPENGVYPKRLGQVIELLKQLVHRTEGVRFPQIIMTTHSPYVLSFFEPEEVTLLSRPSGPADAPVRARPLRDAPNIRKRLGSEFYLGELWYNLSEEELFSDAQG